MRFLFSILFAFLYYLFEFAEESGGPLIVIPADAGIQVPVPKSWIPARATIASLAGMTE